VSSFIWVRNKMEEGETPTELPSKNKGETHPRRRFFLLSLFKNLVRKKRRRRRRKMRGRKGKNRRNPSIQDQ